MQPPTASHLRGFGVAVVAASAALSFMLWQSTRSVAFAVLAVTVGIVFAAVYYSFPKLQPAVYAGFHTVTFPIRFFATAVVLGIVYYLVLLPVAVWYRGRGKSLRRFDRTATTNWHRCDPGDDDDPDRSFRTY